MENNLMMFQHPSFGTIRTVKQGAEILFIAADICKALELGQVTNTIRRLDEDEKALISIKGINKGNDKINAVNEYGLYNLVLSSRKPEAKAFKRWITHDVLPSVRKTGSYSVAQKVPTNFYEALMLAAQQEKELMEARPKVAFVDTYVSKGRCVSLTEMGKKLGKRPRKFIDFLRSEGYFTQSYLNLPYQRYIDAGIFEVRTSGEYGVSQTVVTPKGIAYFAEKYGDVIV